VQFSKVGPVVIPPTGVGGYFKFSLTGTGERLIVNDPPTAVPTRHRRPLACPVEVHANSCSGQRESPRDKLVASERASHVPLAASVNLHEASSLVSPQVSQATVRIFSRPSRRQRRASGGAGIGGWQEPGTDFGIISAAGWRKRCVSMWSGPDSSNRA
jgi:hypothetical protein